MYRFKFQIKEKKIREKSLKKSQAIISLEDMILSFKESQTEGKLSK